MTTHCPKCHATWTRASNTAHCPTCHRTFSTPRVFDAHLKPVNQDGCHDPATVTKRKSGAAVYGSPRPNAYGTDVWRLAGPEDGHDWTAPNATEE